MSTFDYFVASAVVGVLQAFAGVRVRRRLELHSAVMIVSTIEFAWLIVSIFWVLDWQAQPWRWVPLSYIGYNFAWWTYFLCVRPQMPEDPREFSIPRSWGTIGTLFGVYFAVVGAIAAYSVR